MVLMDELEHTFDDEALDAFRPRRPAGSELVDRIGVRRRAINALEAEQLVDMLDFVETCRAEAARITPGLATPAGQAAVHDLSLALDLAPGIVTSRLASARRARGLLPTVWRAFLAGSISTWHMSVIDRQLRRFTRPESATEVDDALAAYAASHTPTQTGRWLARRVERIEADAAEARHRRARADRHVRTTDAGDGMSWLTALLPAVDAAAIAQRLDTEARSLRSDDTRSHDQACADILTGLLIGSSDPDESTGGVRTVIGVTVPVTSLMGLDDAPGELSDGSASLPAALVREHALLPGTLFHRLLTDPHGHLLDVAHLGRFAPDKIRTALWFRDKTTGFPTSTVPAERCDSDHVDPWPAPTEGDNLLSLHRQAHRLKTMGFYQVRRRGRAWEWITHTGHTYRRDPETLPVEHWPEPLRPPESAAAA